MVELMTCCPGLSESEDCQIVAFGAAAGENDLRRTASQQSGHRFARMLDRRPRLLSMMMDGRRVPEVLPEVGLHGLKDRGQHGGGGVVVEIDAAHGYYVSALDAACIEQSSVHWNVPGVRATCEKPQFDRLEKANRCPR